MFDWRREQSICESIRLNSLVSSVKHTMFVFKVCDISDIIIRNRTDPKTLPCGTPLMTGHDSPTLPLILT